MGSRRRLAGTRRLWPEVCGSCGRRPWASAIPTWSCEAIWQYSLQSYEDPQSTPTIDGTSVYFLDKKGTLLCLDAQTGKLRWKKDIVSEYGAVKPSYGFAGSPVVARRILLLNANCAGMALNPETGRLIWASEKPTAKVNRLLNPRSV